MAGKLPAIRAAQGDCQWPLKNGDIPTTLVISQSFVNEEIPIYI